MTRLEKFGIVMVNNGLTAITLWTWQRWRWIPVPGGWWWWLGWGIASVLIGCIAAYVLFSIEEAPA